MVLPILGANTESAAYEIDNSIRFNDDDSPDLDRAVVAGNRDVFTFSTWFKRSNIKPSGEMFLFAGSTDGSNNTELKIQNDQITFITYDGSSNISYVRGNAKLRDTAAWYHVVYQIDTTQSTASNRVKIYINGSQVTSLDQNTYQNQNTDTMMNANGGTHRIGADARTAANFFDGYIAETHYLDGTAYDASYFGETNDNGVWIPKEYSGSYGTNGFFLEFQQTGTSANSSGIGADTSGNDHHFTVGNMTAIDITTDTPTNNFATMDPNTAGSAQPVLREGNTKQHSHGTANSAAVASTIMPDAGKWYVELLLESPSSGDYPFLGITDNINLGQQDGSSAGDNGSKMAAGFEIDGATNNQGTTLLGSITNTNTGWPTFADGDIVQFALDLDNRKLWLGRNGTYINSGNPAAGSNEQLAWTISTNVSVCMLGYDGSGGGGAQSKWNFGNPAFAISSGNADANGYGNFEYAPPTGYLALCTKNLAEIS